MSDAMTAAAEVTGLIQQALEKLHELRTYHLSSSMNLRHEQMLAGVARSITDARNNMASLALLLGKEGA